MLIVISPAKTLDFSVNPINDFTKPDFLKYSEELVEILKGYNSTKLAKLMSVSQNIADLNVERFKNFTTPFNLKNSKQALLAFKGDVYQGFNLDEYKKKDYEFAQNHLRILSGLYGLLRPMDLIQPYRLEMGCKLKNDKGNDLYSFWDDIITNAILKSLQEQGDNNLINLASNEYFKSLKIKKMTDINIITPSFKQLKNGEYKMIALFAKKARGMMSDFIIRNKITKPKDILEFDIDGYKFNSKLSNDEYNPVFTRKSS